MEHCLSFGHGLLEMASFPPMSKTSHPHWRQSVPEKFPPTGGLPKSEPESRTMFKNLSRLLVVTDISVSMRTHFNVYMFCWLNPGVGQVVALELVYQTWWPWGPFCSSFIVFASRPSSERLGHIYPIFFPPANPWSRLGGDRMIVPGPRGVLSRDWLLWISPPAQYTMRALKRGF